MSSSSTARLSVPDHVFARLSEAILGGVYQAGEFLPSQRALAADLGVNMASVREALGRLEQVRLIDIRHGDGARVLDWRRSGGLEALLNTDLGDAESLLRDLFEARRLLLVESARWAATRRTDEQVSSLIKLADAVALAVDDHATLLANWVFMAAVVEAAGNLVFQLVMNSVRDLYLPYADAFAALVSEREQRAPLYLRVAHAIRDGEADEAADAMGELADAQAVGMTG
jgi:DNA-binding FadR family transcriptional regulator